MATKTINALSSGSALAGTEEIPAWQSSATVRTTVSAILTYILGQTNSWTAKQTITLATEQLRLRYDATYYLSVIVGSDGAVNLAPSVTYKWLTYNGSQAFRTSYFGYSASYYGVQVGNGTKGLFLNYDPSANSSGSFSGTEIVVGNTQSFICSNAAGNAFLHMLSSDASNNIRLGNVGGYADYAAYINTSGQVTIGASSPAAQALLTLTSTTKGFAPPRMTTTQRDVITSPVEGLIVYNTTTHKINVYTGSAWEAVTSA